MDYKSQRIDDQSYEDLRLLHKLSFGSDYSLQHFEEKYDTMCFGLKNVGIIAKDDNDDLAAFYGVLPMILSYDQKDFSVAQSGDTMTAPNHRKKGLFTKLAKETYHLASDLNINLIFGFPNQNSLPGFRKKLDWEFHETMYSMKLSVITLPLCEFVSKYKWFKPIYNKYYKNRLKKYIVNPSSVNLDGFNSSKVLGQIKKDIIFFNFKTKKEGVFLIKKDDFLFLIKITGHLVIGDIAYVKKEDQQRMLNSIMELAKELGCLRIRFNMSPNHWVFPFLNSKYELKESLPIGGLILNKDIDLSQIQFCTADYDTF